MIQRLLRLSFLLLCLALAGEGLAAQPAGPAPRSQIPGVDPAALDHLIQTLQDPKSRDQFISDLKALQAAQHGAAPTQAPLPNALGARLLQAMSDAFGRLRTGIEDLRASVGDPTRLWAWAKAEVEDPGRRGQLLEFLWQLLVIMTGGLIADLLARRFVRRSQGRLRPAIRPRPLRRAGLLVSHSALELLPIVVFAAAAYAVVALVQPGSALRLAILAIVGAVVIARAGFVLFRFLLSPFAPSLRLLPIGDETAAYFYVWALRLISLGVYGYFLLQVALLLGLPFTAYGLALRVLGLIIVLLLAAVILQSRQAVASLIARDRPGRMRSRSLAQIRRRLAQSWHVLALIYLVAVYLAWAAEVPGGFAYLGRGTGLSLLILAIAWLALILVRRGFDRFLAINRELLARYPLLESRANRYLPILRAGLNTLIRVVALIAVLDAWQADIGSILASRPGREVIGRLATILVMVAVALLIWELVSAGISFYLERRDAEGRPLLQSSRARTLLPLVRNALFVVICIMAGLTILSELGVDIAPLLAGAGVVGLAIGFGAQALVKDVITGAFILFEDTVNVGDGVTINGISGGVEAISIRTIRIRDGDGTLHTIPFGQVGAVSNMTKGYSYFSADVAIGYQEDIDKVIAALRQVFADLSGDPGFRPDILGDLEVSGIDRFTDTAVYLRVRIRTLPARQGAVGHEFNRRMKMKFDQLGIQLSPAQRAVSALAAGSRTDAAADGAPAQAPAQAKHSS